MLMAKMESGLNFFIYIYIYIYIYMAKMESGLNFFIYIYIYMAKMEIYMCVSVVLHYSKVFRPGSGY